MRDMSRRAMGLWGVEVEVEMLWVDMCDRCGLPVEIK